MQIDRELQRYMLIKLKEHYQRPANYAAMMAAYSEVYPDAEYVGPLTDHPIDGNLYYLEELGLVTITPLSNGGAIGTVKITAKGIDFLEDDGGLTAILNTVTVKFDVDNVRELVETGLLKANVPEEKKSALKEALRNAPGTVFQKITDKLLEKAVNDPMALVRTLGEVLDKAI